MSGERESGCGWDLWRDAPSQEAWRRVMARAMQTSRKGLGPDDESLADAIRVPRPVVHEAAHDNGMSWSLVWRGALLSWWGARGSWNSAGRSSVVLGKCAKKCRGWTIFWRDRQGRGYVLLIGSLGGLGHTYEKSLRPACFPICAGCDGKLIEV